MERRSKLLVKEVVFWEGGMSGNTEGTLVIVGYLKLVIGSGGRVR